MPTDVTPQRIHYLLIRHIIAHGHAPSLAQIAELTESSEGQAGNALKELEKAHGVILVPGSMKVWNVHPFALNPTAFWVSTALGGWWANCAWCSLAIGAALKQDVKISTREGGDGGLLEFAIKHGKASRTDVLMNFPYPPGRWWENPFAPCVNILFFSSERGIAGWSERHGHPRGSFLSLATAIRLAELWFGDYASADWVRKTPERANEIFRELDLDPTFWQIISTFR